MRRYLLVPLGLSLLSLPSLVGADSPSATPAAVAPTGPWTETFTMVLRDTDRTYVVHDGASYLLTQPSDFEDQSFLVGKDVAILGKFQRGQDRRVWLYRPADLEVVAEPEQWSDKVDGDNCYFFGHIDLSPEGHAQLLVRSVAAAPSDTEIIHARAVGIPTSAWDQRLALAAWVRDHAATEGNQEWWLQQADALLTKTIADACALAASTKDGALLLRAMGWAEVQQKDPIAAARIASAPWVQQLDEGTRDAIAQRMRRLGMAYYHNQWRPRGEALALEFEDRLAVIPWRDADGFYKLGRWADANAEFLPQAKDRAYRAYSAGLKANPDHEGIRRALGMDIGTPVDVSHVTAAAEGRIEYKDPALGIVVISPAKWKRGDGVSEGVRFDDPTSDTASVAVRFLTVGAQPAEQLWTSISAHARAHTDFVATEDSVKHLPTQTRYRLVYSYSESRLPRLAAMVFLIDTASKLAVVAEAGYVEDERERTLKALDDVLDHVVFPGAAPATAAGTTPPADAQATPAAPAPGAGPAATPAATPPTAPAAAPPAEPPPPPRPKVPTPPSLFAPPTS